MLDISTSTASPLLGRLVETHVEATVKSLVTSVEPPPDPPEPLPEPPGGGPEDPPPRPQLTVRATVTNDKSNLELAIGKLLKLIRD